MQFERFFTINLDKGRADTVDLGPIFFQGDINPMKLGVKLVNSEGDVDVSGSVSARAVAANGTPVSPLTTGCSGNIAWCIIPQEALAYPGMIKIFLKLADTNDTAVTLYAYGRVNSIGDGSPVNPGTPVPSYEDLQEAAQDCIAATEAAQAIVDQGAVTASVSGTTLVITTIE